MTPEFWVALAFVFGLYALVMLGVGLLMSFVSWARGWRNGR